MKTRGWIPPIRQLFEVHGSELKPDPVCHLGQASVCRIAHPMLFLCIGKYALYHPTSQGIG